MNFSTICPSWPASAGRATGTTASRATGSRATGSRATGSSAALTDHPPGGAKELPFPFLAAGEKCPDPELQTNFGRELIRVGKLCRFITVQLTPRPLCAVIPLRLERVRSGKPLKKPPKQTHFVKRVNTNLITLLSILN